MMRRSYSRFDRRIGLSRWSWIKKIISIRCGSAGWFSCLQRQQEREVKHGVEREDIERTRPAGVGGAAEPGFAGGGEAAGGMRVDAMRGSSGGSEGEAQEEACGKEMNLAGIEA